jgi:hypothetical protein
LSAVPLSILTLIGGGAGGIVLASVWLPIGLELYLVDSVTFFREKFSTTGHRDTHSFCS